MKAARIILILLAAVTLVFGLSGAAFAFHNGGVGFCEGCHTMHNSVTGGTVAFIANGTTGANGMSSTNGVKAWTGTPLNGNTTANGGASYGGIVGQGENQYLLRGSDPSSTCLNCHAATKTTPAYYQEMSVSTGGANFIQHEAGDFRWVATDYTYTLTNPDMSTTTAVSKGLNHGHAVVAQDFGMSPNTLITAAPGSTVINGTGAYPSGNLACNSCHDPHGAVTATGGGSANGGGKLPISGSGSYGGTAVAGTQLGAYRLLAGKNYDPGGSSALKENGTGYDPTDSVLVGFPVQVSTDTSGSLNGMTGYYNNPLFTNGSGIKATAYQAASGNGQNNWTVTANPTAGSPAHNIYVQGMSEFCSSCHNQFLNNRATIANNTHRHPSGVKQWIEQTGQGTNASGNMDALYGNYNDYAGTGNYASGATGAGYWPLVPVELYGISNSSAVTDTTIDTNTMVQNTANVMCLTCHRAHASGFDHDTRWDTYATFISDSSVDHTSLANATDAYYGQTFGTYQRQLCNKCHVQD